MGVGQVRGAERLSLDGVGLRTDAVFEIEMPELLKGETDDVNGHAHSFVVKFDEAGNFLGGYTNPGPNGHVHQILHGTVRRKPKTTRIASRSLRECSMRKFEIKAT